VFAVQLPAETVVGRDVQLSYSGLGTVIHARAVIGSLAHELLAREHPSH